MIIRKRTWWWIGLGLIMVMMISAGLYWYLATEKFADTKTRKPHLTTNALDFIREFEADHQSANVKYADKIIAVNGTISEIEPADSMVNIKFADSSTGSYIIFAFQEQDVQEARRLKEGDSVSIKGSFSSGLFSDILGTTFITFKRSALNK